MNATGRRGRSGLGEEVDVDWSDAAKRALRRAHCALGRLKDTRSHKVRKGRVKAFGSSGVVLTLIGHVFGLITISLVCAVFPPVWGSWRQTEKQRREPGSVVGADENTVGS